MGEVAIHTEGLTRMFGALRAVDALDLEVGRGEIFGFLGANGAGKTTTIHLLLGLIEPTAGTAQVLGYDVRTQANEVRAHTGALLEFSGLYERLSAEENLDFFGRVYHMSASDRQARIKELLTHLDLYDRRKERVSTWSRGMKQKLAIARVLLHRPALAFLDEPTAGLDPVAAAALRDDLEGLATREGLTVFLTTHNLPEAERLCARVGVIRSGKLLAVGTPDMLRAQTGEPRAEISGHGFTEAMLAALRARPEVSAVEARPDHLSITLRGSGASVAPIVRELVLSGADIEEVQRGAASLEEAFLALMGEQRAEERVEERA